MTPDDQEDVFAKGLRVAYEILDLMNSGPLRAEKRGTPDAEALGGVRVRQPYRYILSMYARTRSYFRSILLLMSHSYADEAMALGRSLFEDSLRMDILRAMPDEESRVDATIRWALDGINRGIGLHQTAKKTGVGER